MATLKKIIIIEYKGQVEAWTTLTKLCEVHNLPYKSLREKEFPYTLRGIKFTKHDVNEAVFKHPLEVYPET